MALTYCHHGDFYSKDSAPQERICTEEIIVTLAVAHYPGL